MRPLTAVELYKELESNFNVTSSYRVGFSKDVSPGVLEVLKYLKQDPQLSPEDIVPVPTKLTVTLKDKSDTIIIGTFNQASDLYMDKLDFNAFEDFATNHLINKLAQNN